jgi:hypothetical protein
MRNLPFAAFEHNQFWLELSLIAGDARLAAASLLCGRVAFAQPKPLGQRVLHVAVKLAYFARRTVLHVPRSWLWAEALAMALTRQHSLAAASP